MGTSQAIPDRPTPDAGPVPSRLPTHSFGATGLQVTPLALAALGVRAHGPPGLRLLPDDVEAAYHEHGIDTFLVHPWLPHLIVGVRRLVRAGHRGRLTLITEVGIPLGPRVRRHWGRVARLLGVDVIDVYLYGWHSSRVRAMPNGSSLGPSRDPIPKGNLSSACFISTLRRSAIAERALRRASRRPSAWT
jgi:hypothetical protein